MKSALILLHGALGSKAQLDHLGALLSTTHDVFTFNLPGHGGEPLPEAFSIDLFAEATYRFIQTHRLERPYLFGYSMGGYIALKLALDHPMVVRAVVTLGTKFKWDPESAAKEVRMMNPDIIEQKIPAFAATLENRHSPEDWKQVMRLTAEMMSRMGDGEALGQASFKAIQQPALICIGTDDHMVTREESVMTAGLLPQGSCQVLEGFRHPLEAIDQELMAGTIQDFLAGSAG